MVQRPATEVVVDEAAMLIGVAAEPDAAVAAARARLDDLAAAAPAGGVGPLLGHLFGAGGLRGNTTRYDDPANSYLHRVLERGVGIPISLAVVAMGVGRRVGVDVVGVGMPGHFLVAEVGAPGRWYDPFDGGRDLDLAAARRLHATVLGADAPFDPSLLAPVGPHEVLARMLRNLRAGFLARGDRTSLLWVLRLRSALPGCDAEERAELASVLAASGDFLGAATELDALAAEIGGDLGARFGASADRLRARLN
jgi:regulator of sirC expression with transglutaminase-like and TPR domain